MFAEILTIGDELCRGEITNTNSSWLAQELWALDVTTAWMTSCRDLRDDMREAFREAISRADLVLVSGGLGPTEDDLTVDVVAELAGTEAVVDDAARARMEQRFSAAGAPLVANQRRQVRVPAGARVLGNPVGAAPGFEVVLGEVPVICMPGVPAELQAIFTSAVVGRVEARRQALGQRSARMARRTYRVFGRGESQVAAALDGVLAGVDRASLHFQVAFPEVLVKVLVRDQAADAAAARLAAVDAEVRARLGHHLYGVDDDCLAAALGRALAARGATLATAESCTGGLIGALITEVPGSSAYFTGGAITYSNEEKVRQLGVARELLAEHGAVSEPCVQAMARGARERFGVDYAVAVSGVAGPTGGTPDKPVGTVWLAVAGPSGVRTKLVRWPGERRRVQRLSAYWALALTRAAVTRDTKESDHG